MAKTKIVVLSVDALVYEDLEYLSDKPNFSLLREGGSIVKRVRTIYPTVTYPCHVSMSTGAYPNKHGVTNNFLFLPGQLKNLPWNWFADVIKTPDIFTAAKSAGLTTAAVFWPVTGNHKDIDYLVAEYWPQTPTDTHEECFKRAGTTHEVWEKCIKPFSSGVVIRKHPVTDWFVMQSACSMIRNFKPDLLLIHTGNIDAYRHSNGVFAERVTMGLDEVETHIGILLQAARDAGVFEETNFFLVSDHGQLDVVRSIKPNVVFADHGLIEVNEDGTLRDWKAYVQSAGLSAQVHLKDPDDRELWQKTYDLLKYMRDEGIYGISEVYTAEEINEREHLFGDFSFVLETDGYTTFSEDWVRPMIKNLDVSDYRFGHATHGHNPDKGAQPVFVAYGPDIKKGVEIERRPIVDEAPTYAKILGVDMPWADGVPIDEILK
ncbi:MAG: alkaline phosphatase family protein [Clostridiales bacterium]|nr:alkaline phosphatase family protein [Clostridiales bacterium]